MMSSIQCPLLNKEIDICRCCEIVDVCDGFFKERVLQKEVLEIPNWRETCEKCKYHDLEYV